MNCEGYTKLSASILTSTVWVESDQTLRVWITILALCDRNGFVSGTIPGLANVARVAVDACREAVGKFLSPDTDSRTKEHEGRRIECVDGGWFVLNHAKYRDERDPDSRREQTRRAVAKHRQKKKLAADAGKPCKPELSPSKPKKAQAEAEAEAEAEAVQAPLPPCGERPLPSWEFCLQWLASAKKTGADYTEAETRNAYTALAANGWMWGKNPITDPRAALERQINTDRDRKPDYKKRKPSAFAIENFTRNART